MFYLIGAGLRDGKDISLRAQEVLKNCSKVFLEGYTSLLNATHEELVTTWGEFEVVDRGFVETTFEKEWLPKAKKEDIAILVIGDAMSATTHSALILEAKKQQVPFEVIHNASVLTAVGVTGLELYKFGYAVSLPYPEHDVLPKSAFERVKANLSLGMHTLVLLDIKASEQRYMSVKEGIDLLLKMGLHQDTLLVGCARLGWQEQHIKVGIAKELQNIDFGKNPHCIIIPGKLHFLEEELLNTFR